MLQLQNYSYGTSEAKKDPISNFSYSKICFTIGNIHVCYMTLILLYYCMVHILNILGVDGKSLGLKMQQTITELKTKEQRDQI